MCCVAFCVVLLRCVCWVVELNAVLSRVLMCCVLCETVLCCTVLCEGYSLIKAIGFFTPKAVLPSESEH